MYMAGVLQRVSHTHIFTWNTLQFPSTLETLTLPAIHFLVKIHVGTIPSPEGMQLCFTVVTDCEEVYEITYVHRP